MCQAAVGVITKALPQVDNAESILKIKNLIALFMQTMNVCCAGSARHILEPRTLTKDQAWEFPVGVFDNFQLKLFEKYAELLKRRFSDDFQEV